MMAVLERLKRFAAQARAILARDGDVADFNFYCSACEQRVARFNFTSELACRGVEELKSDATQGFALRLVMRGDGPQVAEASVCGDLSLEEVAKALKRAKQTTVCDRYFPGLPAPPPLRRPSARPEPELLRLSDAALAEAAWRTVEGALVEAARAEQTSGKALGLVLGGDISVGREEMALCSSRFEGVRADQDARFTASVAALVEEADGKGTAGAAGRSAGQLCRVVPGLGRAALRRALALGRGVRPAPGKYRLLLGPQPVAEILHHVVVPSLTAESFYAASSAYQGRFGLRVMDRQLSLADEPAARFGAIRRLVTCEGFRAGRTELVRDGRLLGLLASFQDGARLWADEQRREKLGRGADRLDGLVPNGGYRNGEAGLRRFDAGIGSAGTNIVMSARAGAVPERLARAVRQGLYVGRIWYTYPINGQRAGDFTCTITGDSWLIEKGRAGAPVAPNCLRINASAVELFAAVVAAGNRRHPALVWGAPQVYYVPELVVEGVALSAVEQPAAP
jgi:PmbA protein